MKEKFLIVVNVFLVVVLVFMGIQLHNVKQNVPAENPENRTSEEKNDTYKEAITNPIDPLFAKALNSHQSQTAYRALQDLYYDTWKAQYDHIMNLIYEKCQYDEDIANYHSFIKEMENEVNGGFAKMNPLMINEMSDNYNMPESPEKHSYGNGVHDALLMYQGTIYRNACMFFIPSLNDDEYNFPIAEVKLAIDKVIG